MNMPFTTTPPYANRLGWSDAHPYEVLRRVSGRCLEIRAMNATRDPEWKPEFIAGGFAGHCTNNSEQLWHFASDERFPAFRIRLHKGGQWKDANGNRYSLDSKPVRFHDYNF